MVMMYPARIPPIETTASGKGRWEVGRPMRAVSTARLANGSRGGKDANPMLTPPPPIESCLGGQEGGVTERGEVRGRRRQVELAQERAVQRKTL